MSKEETVFEKFVKSDRPAFIFIDEAEKIFRADSRNTAKKIIQIAKDNVNNKPKNYSSAKLCLEDAQALFERGSSLGTDDTFKYATSRATKSLEYSCGMFSPKYREAMNIFHNLVR